MSKKEKVFTFSLYWLFLFIPVRRIKSSEFLLIHSNYLAPAKLYTQESTNTKHKIQNSLKKAKTREKWTQFS